MTNRQITVLLVDGQVEDSNWVQELLAELEERRFAVGWMHGLKVLPVDRLADALTVLADRESKDQFDVVLLNPSLPDSFGLHTYLRLQGLAADTPVVILADLDDPDLAISMIRAGAQDFLAKTQLESLPLARALRLAVERQRIIRDQRALSARDDLTGLANRNGFEDVTGRDLALAERLNVMHACIVLELEGLEQLAHVYGRDERQLALIEASDLIRTVFPSPACVGRLREHRFAVSAVTAAAQEVESGVTHIRRGFHTLSRKANRTLLALRYGISFYPSDWPRGLPTVAELIAMASTRLCENVVDTPSRFVQKGSSANRELANIARRNL